MDLTHRKTVQPPLSSLVLITTFSCCEHHTTVCSVMRKYPFVGSKLTREQFHWVVSLGSTKRKKESSGVEKMGQMVPLYKLLPPLGQSFFYIKKPLKKLYFVGKVLQVFDNFGCSILALLFSFQTVTRTVRNITKSKLFSVLFLITCLFPFNKHLFPPPPPIVAEH